MIEKKNIYKKQIVCTNCAKIGHYYRNCNEPTISIGIIMVKIDNNINKDKLIQLLQNGKYNVLTNKKYIKSDLYNFFLDKIKFLLIRRKHSYSYMSFINGKYDLNDLAHIANLFKYMSKEEVTKISTCTFDQLWKDIWFNFGIDDTHNTFNECKLKFEQLKNIDHFNLEFYLNNIKNVYESPEWGLPKGKRNLHENNEECAIREVFEETGLNKNNYTLCTNIIPINELIANDNNSNIYKYIYYVGIYNDGDIIDNKDMNNNAEIGDIGWFNINEINILLRSYHKRRYDILNKLYQFIIDKLISDTQI